MAVEVAMAMSVNLHHQESYQFDHESVLIQLLLLLQYLNQFPAQNPYRMNPSNRSIHGVISVTNRVSYPLFWLLYVDQNRIFSSFWDLYSKNTKFQFTAITEYRFFLDFSCQHRREALICTFISIKAITKIG